MPELSLVHESIEVRSRSLRVGWNCGRNVASDYAVLERAAPYLHQMARSCLVGVLEGEGRFEESGRRAWLERGSVIVHDQRRGGVHGYAGAVSSYFVVEWDPAAWGIAAASRFVHHRLEDRDLERLRADMHRLRDAAPSVAAAGIVERLRGLGLGFARVGPTDLLESAPDSDQDVLDVVSERLSAIETRPSIDEVSMRLAMSARQLSRRYGGIAQACRVPWRTWRVLLHAARMITALRLLATGRAATEFAAQRSGFRSAEALCHALADAGLPSPGVLGRAARREILEGWTAFAERPAAVLSASA